VVATLMGMASFAQDLILKQDGSEIKAKVLEITDQQIKYKEFDFQSGPTRNINIYEVFMITYENGQKEVFKKPLETKDISSELQGVTINGVIWATKNIGASNPEDYGTYYTQEQAKTACPQGWRLPTELDFRNLRAIGATYAEQNGIAGAKFGYENNYIFLPANGRYLSGLFGAKMDGVGSAGHYWSSTSGAKYTYDFSFFLGYSLKQKGMVVDKIWIMKNYNVMGEAVRCIKE